MENSKKTRVEWLALVGEWEESGESQRAFCEAHGLKMATFGYWRGQHLREVSSPDAGFVALKPLAGLEGVRLRMGGLEVELLAEAGFVAEVLLKLAGRC